MTMKQFKFFRSPLLTILLLMGFTFSSCIEDLFFSYDDCNSFTSNCEVYIPPGPSSAMIIYGHVYLKGDSSSVSNAQIVAYSSPILYQDTVYTYADEMGYYRIEYRLPHFTEHSSGHLYVYARANLDSLQTLISPIQSYAWYFGGRNADLYLE